MPPPPIPTAPAGGDRNKGPSIEITGWVLSSIALVTVILRLYGRLRITKNLGWDDFWMVIAMIANLIFTGLAEAAIKDGFGRHPYYLGLEETSKAIKWTLITFVPGIMSFNIPKLSVTILLTRLLNPPKYQKYFMYFLSYSCIIWASVVAALVWQQCKPTAALWNPLLAPTAKCWNDVVVTDISIAQGSLAAFTDFYLALYPAFVIYKLKINWKKKLGLTIVLGIGLVACVVATYKCTRLPELNNHLDYTYATSDLLIWTSVESCVIIIAADVATLRPVFLHFTGRDGSTQSGSSFAKNSRPSYRMDYISDASTGRGKKGPKDPYPTETVAEYESEEHILPPNRIRRTDDVEVVNDSNSGAPRVSEEYIDRVTRFEARSRY